jgi:hypothetical protein
MGIMCLANLFFMYREEIDYIIKRDDGISYYQVGDSLIQRLKYIVVVSSNKHLHVFPL